MILVTGGWFRWVLVFWVVWWVGEWLLYAFCGCLWFWLYLVSEFGSLGLLVGFLVGLV